VTELEVARHSHLVDPTLHVWGWEIPVYLFLGGMAAGVMVLTTLLLARPGERSRALRWLPFAAPLLVTVGMGALFLDLEHKLFVWRFYLAFRWTSPMSWGSWILLVVYPVSCWWPWRPWRRIRRPGWPAAAVRSAGWCCGPGPALPRAAAAHRQPGGVGWAGLHRRAPLHP
jgi:hypothetical protein